METKKHKTIGFRVTESMKETLSRIADLETRNISLQVEHFVKQGIEKYSEENPEFSTDKKADNNKNAKLDEK